MEEGLARRVLSASQQNQGLMGSAEAWSNGQEIPTKDLLCIDGGGVLVGCFSEDVQAGLVLLALDQALMLEGSQQEASRVDALTTEQTSEQHRCYRVRDVACCVDLAPGHPLLREEPASVVRCDSVVGLSCVVSADLIGKHSGVGQAGA